MTSPARSRRKRRSALDHRLDRCPPQETRSRRRRRPGVIADRDPTDPSPSEGTSGVFGGGISGPLRWPPTPPSTSLAGRCSWPTWSPGGSEIAFTGGNDFGRPLYKVHPDGTGLRTILPASQPPSHDFPSWSPAGDRIAYATFHAGNDCDLVTVRPDGSGVRTVFRASCDFAFIDFGPAGS